MVNLRSRAALEVAKTVSTNGRSISSAFVAEKASVQGRRKRAKTEAEDNASTTTTALLTQKPVADVVEKSAKKSRKVVPNEVEVAQELPFLSREEVIKATTIAYPKLPFQLSEAVQHLRSVDVRFHRLLDTIELTPYNELIQGQVKELDLFRTLTSSVLGQQVSWLAARAILYRFIRLFFPSLPEKPDFNLRPRESLPFPHPIDVAKNECTEEILRSAGLSGAKVKYIKDIAKRFSDGRLDARKIVQMEEEECIEELVKIKGVGKWTAEMLLMFALRRANILPVGDLGVQRGMVLFYLSGPSGPSISKRKKKKGEGKDEGEEDSKPESTTIIKAEEVHLQNDPLPTVETHLNESQAEVEQAISEVENVQTGPDVVAPKIKSDTAEMQPLPDGIAHSLLKSRSEGKKAKGNVYLTPSEMEALAQPWAPFRSVATFLMWTCVDGD